MSAARDESESNSDSAVQDLGSRVSTMYHVGMSRAPLARFQRFHASTTESHKATSGGELGPRIKGREHMSIGPRLSVSHAYFVHVPGCFFFCISTVALFRSFPVLLMERIDVSKLFLMNKRDSKQRKTKALKVADGIILTLTSHSNPTYPWIRSTPSGGFLNNCQAYNRPARANLTKTVRPVIYSATNLSQDPPHQGPQQALSAFPKKKGRQWN
ncbi:hypothetical protein F4778DRAFT_460442 [Xylariomycetidae sp. FL2044]|nr:hypothetical protein F4778DRAFT_460442 [Xylariomycetidae sp. FL2044]